MGNTGVFFKGNKSFLEKSLEVINFKNKNVYNKLVYKQPFMG